MGLYGSSMVLGDRTSWLTSRWTPRGLTKGTLGSTSRSLQLSNKTLLSQAASSMLLANVEREKELLRVFLKVSQMENKILRRMNLSSFLMVSYLAQCLPDLQKKTSHLRHFTVTAIHLFTLNFYSFS